MSKKFLLALFLQFFIIAIVIESVYALVSYNDGSTALTNARYFQPSYERYYTSSQIADYWPLLSEPDKCGQEGTDFIIQIAPAGCTPSVVRSDLLEEQNVPVFCQLMAIKVNPLIDVNKISSISFSGKYPQEIAGIGFHPARAAIRTREELLGDPIEENIGYVIILLKRQINESSMPDWVQGNLTARIRYDTSRALGIGRGEFELRVMEEDEWQRDYKENVFWRGRGYLRVDWVEEDRAGISIYETQDRKITSFVLEKGKTSQDIYIPGYYCRAGLNIKLNSITTPSEKAKIFVDDDEYWVTEGEKFYDSKCRIEKLTISDFGSGSAYIVCPRQRFTLTLGTANSVVLDVEGFGEDSYAVGEYLGNNQQLRLVYVGKLSERITVKEEDKERDFVIIAKTSLDENKIRDKIPEVEKELEKLVAGRERVKTKEDFVKNATEKVKSIYGPSSNPLIIFKEKKESEIAFVDFGEAIGKSYEKKVVENVELGGEIGKALEYFFEQAKNSAKNIAKLYGSEENAAQQRFGEIALFEQAMLANKLGKFKEEKELLNELVARYPDSSHKYSAQSRIIEIENYDSEKASAIVNIDDELHVIRLAGLRKPTLEEASVEIKIGDEEKAGFYLVGEIAGDTKKETPWVYVKEIHDDYALLEFSHRNEKGEIVTSAEKINPSKPFYIQLKKDEKETIAVLEKINLKRAVKVSLTPKTFWDYSETNFSFQIGIEKRGIQLSPEKTKEMIGNINESIEKFEKITENLGNIVKGWKGVCYATQAVLTLKNFFENMGGKSLARQKVMKSPGGWTNKICPERMKEEPTKYASLEDCLRKNNDEIEEAVNSYTKAMQTINAKAKTITDDKDYAENYRKNILMPAASGTDIILKIDGKDVELEEFLNEKSEFLVKEKGYMTVGDMRDIATWLEFYKTAEDKEMAKTEIARLLRPSYDYVQKYNVMLSHEEAIKKSGTPGANVPIASAERKGTRDIEIITFPYDESGFNKFINSNIILDGHKEMQVDDKRVLTEWIRFATTGSVYLIPLKPLANSKYDLIEATENKEGYSAYKLGIENGKETITEKVSSTYMKNLMHDLDVSGFVKITPEYCRNPYENYEVRYYETAPYKGLPAIVPVDVKNGWYAATKQILTSFQGIKPYEESGRLQSFWLCNVGPNKREEFNSISRDDICTMINIDTGQPLDQIACVDSAEARRLVQAAIRNIQVAAENYKTGIRGGIIELPGVGEVEVGTPAGAAEQGMCQDFMSPEDCYWLFQACDPVLCPSSRCNMAGRYYVDNVIQSGIIGSIALCLPNIKEGIFMPVCLTGVHAGLEFYLSILENRRDCLQESLDTGRSVGICDEMHSIYMCEFFWRNAGPFLRVGPSLISALFGKGERGGGEYANFGSAWENAQESVDYMVNVYGVNARNAFRARSTEEVGTEICKMFVSTRYPSGNFFDQLLEPDSPTQFYAYFSEIPFTEATIPATSQYKVYYHIFAGKDEGNYYSVWLQNPPETSYYASALRVMVATGYINSGDYASETRDFTAPSGYRELCVRVGWKEECGFGKVSTAWVFDYLSDMYAKEQIKENIKTEKDCISGTPSIYSMFQLNLQEGLQETITPEMYKKGIIRICASQNPGNSTEQTRWKRVGYCGSPEIGCWMDTESVKDVIKDKELEKELVGDLNARDLASQIEGKEAMTVEETESLLKQIDEALKELEKKSAESLVTYYVDNILKIKSEEKSAPSEQTTTSQPTPTPTPTTAKTLLPEDVHGLIKYIKDRVKDVSTYGRLNMHRAQALFYEFEMYYTITSIIWNKYGNKLAEADVTVSEEPPPTKPKEKTEYKVRDVIDFDLDNPPKGIFVDKFPQTATLINVLSERALVNLKTSKIYRIYNENGQKASKFVIILPEFSISNEEIFMNIKGHKHTYIFIKDNEIKHHYYTRSYNGDWTTLGKINEDKTLKIYWDNVRVSGGFVTNPSILKLLDGAKISKEKIEY